MNCYKKILSSHDSMSKQQKRIADFILLNINEVVFFSITKLADELDISEATIVRFAQNLGYKGFPELKKDLVNYYQNYLTPGERLKNSIQILAEGDLSFEKVMRNELRYLEETIDTMNSGDFENIVNSICAAERVYIFGLGSGNEPLVKYLGFRLNRFGIDICEVPYSGINMMECVPFIKKGDVAIIFQFIKATPDYYSLTRALKGRGAELYLITDSRNPDLVKGVDTALIINRGPLENYHTLTVPAAVTSAIILGVAEKQSDSAVNHTSRIGDLRQGYYKNMHEIYKHYLEGEKKGGTGVMKKKYNIVSIGHVTSDVRNMMGRKTPFTGGAAYFSPHAAKRSGADVLVITKMAEKDKGSLKALTDAGIDVIALPSKATTSIENIFVTEDQDNRKLKLLSLANSFTASDIPDDIEADVFHVAALFSGEVPEEMLEALSKRGKVALDLQAALRYIGEDDVYFKDWENKKKYLPFVHYIKADSLEIEVITGTDDREKAARQILAWGGKEIVITRKDEVLVFDGIKFYRAPFNAKNLDGRAGRGDTCFLSYISRRFKYGIDESVHYAAALTSIKMEAPGPFTGTEDDVLERMKLQAY